MRSRIRFVSVVLASVALALSFLLMGATGSVQAASPNGPSAAGIPVPTNNGSPAFLTQLSGRQVGGGNLIADVNMFNSAITLFDTQTFLSTDCANIAVYRVTEIGDLLLTPETCVGNQLNVIGLGGNFQTDYLLVSFTSPDAAVGAPQMVAHGTY